MNVLDFEAGKLNKET